MSLWHDSVGQGRPLLLIHGWGMNASVWQPLMQQLQADYQSQLPERIEAILNGVNLITEHGSEDESINRLHRVVHQLAGSAATFGFPELGVVARDMEVLMKPWASGSSMPDQTDIKSLQGLADRLEKLKPGAIQ